jgi:hypothetical protein
MGQIISQLYKLTDYIGPGLEISPGEWLEQIGPFTTDANAWAMAEHVAEQHLAGWLFHLAGRPVYVETADGTTRRFQLAHLVTVEGLERRNPHPQGDFTWQVEGAALVMATGMKTPALNAVLADYRTDHGRITRRRTASARRIKLMCAAVEAGATPRQAFDTFKLPSVQRSDFEAIPATPPPTDDVLAFYREAMVSGEVVR